MVDSSPQLPDEARESALRSELAEFDMSDAPMNQRATACQWFRGGWDEAAAHFAAELDGLRAQIEEARAHVAKIDIIMYETGSASVGKLEDILAQSPRGTVARIQADEQTALSALIHGRFEEARGRHGVDPDRVARFILDSNWLAARDRAVREAALEEAAQIAEDWVRGTPLILEGSRGFAADNIAAAIRATSNPFASSGDTTNGDK